MRLLAVVLTLLAVAVAQAAPPPPTTWEKPAVGSVQLPRVRHDTRAVPECKTSAPVDRLNVRQLLRKRRTGADRLNNARRYQEALHVYEDLLAEDDKDVAVLERAAATRMQLGAWHEGAATYDRILDLLGPPPYERPRRRTDLFSGKRISGAEHYHRLLARLSHAWSLIGDHARALEAAEVVRDALEDGIVGRLVLADAWMHAGQPDEAELLYREVLAAEPDNGTALNNLSTVRYLERDLEGTMELLEAVLERSRQPRLEAIALSNVAEVLMLRGDYANAEAHYRSAFEAFPEGGFSHFGLAALENVRGRHDAALDEAITGWDLDRAGMDRHHEYFMDEEWRWQRDALVAEAEGQHEDALDLWDMVAHGNVKRLVLPARAHGRRLRALLAEDL